MDFADLVRALSWFDLGWSIGRFNNAMAGRRADGEETDVIALKLG